MSARTAMLAKIHLAKKQLALTEDSYRDILRRVTNQESASALAEPQLDRVLKEFGRLGWKPRPGRTGTSKHAQIRMIHAVWKDLVALGAVEAEDQAAALRAFVQRQTKTMANPEGVSAPEFLDSHGANKVLEGLKGWLKRVRRAESERNVA
jgi:phage gp16-like protein